MTASGPFVDPLVTRFGDAAGRPRNFGDTHLVTAKHAPNTTQMVARCSCNPTAHHFVMIEASCRSAEPPPPLLLFPPRPMLPPHTLSPHAPGQVAVLSRVSAESHAERRFMFGRARGIQRRSRRVIWLRTGVARSREVVTLFTLFRTRGASKRDATEPFDLAYILCLQLRAKVPTLRANRVNAPATHLVTVFLRFAPW